MKKSKIYANENIVVNCFKKYVFTSLKNYKYAYYKREQKVANNEFPVDEFFAYNLKYSDEYFPEEYEIRVADGKLFIKNELLYEGLTELDETSRTVFYLSSCEELSDRIIGERLNIHRRTVQRIRKKAQLYLLSKLKDLLIKVKP